MIQRPHSPRRVFTPGLCGAHRGPLCLADTVTPHLD
ncbi:hypothetical protein SEA_LARS_61 [Mycobacterium phage Lars]|uniref:Uncharacterized protein n=4 Tax=Rosebushvirus rosebush TaxID=2006145 RepID=A0A0Y0AB78_9CAUD|nr:hypothetical protein SEA_GLASS_61 [Mycobacterium phage Glass]AVE00380.1 hypothetical protein SEA_OPIA_61 [Mycobacterium phage Opia]AXQ52538.1 hypothetical protein SEA_FRENCHFRY_61 [Mycobacterium phage FrenchFry]QWY80983.1 hypothetical protein SEA_LARS_61 [Mycobacterium phage Lars]